MGGGSEGGQRSVSDVPTIYDRSRFEMVGTLRFARPTATAAQRKFRSADVGQIFLENRHLELERAIVVLVIDEQHADEFFADIDFGGVVFFRARHDADLGIAEYALEIGVELPDFLNVHGSLQSDSLNFREVFRTRRRRLPAVTSQIRLRESVENQSPIAPSI